MTKEHRDEDHRKKGPQRLRNQGIGRIMLDQGIDITKNQEWYKIK